MKMTAITKKFFTFDTIMQKSFFKYASDSQLFTKGNSLLIAVSGGIDSVTLLHLLAKSDIKQLAVAHCNFQLRGHESDGDEDFVHNLSESFGLHFFVTHFDTEKYAGTHKISIQEAARTLRYQWFEKIRRKNGFDWIATGHNKDDTVETFLFNLIRGTGPEGLTGIKPKYGKVIRPLLFATRKEITAYANENNLVWREDSSNCFDKYSRNFIRHQIIPKMQQINPQAQEHIFSASQKINDLHKISTESIRNFTNRIVLRQGNKITVSTVLLLKQKHPLPFLHFILKDYGFNPKELRKILDTLNQSGKQFFSPTHTLLTDRDFFFIFPVKKNTTPKSFNITSLLPEISEPVKLKFLIMAKTGDLQIRKNKRFACLDYDKIKFPVIIRKWQNGDSFYPFGMKQRKKLSDYFVDNKFSRLKKDEIWLMETGGEICWLVGERIDNRFAVTGKTKQVLQIEFFEQTLL